MLSVSLSSLDDKPAHLSLYPSWAVGESLKRIFCASSSDPKATKKKRREEEGESLKQKEDARLALLDDAVRLALLVVHRRREGLFGVVEGLAVHLEVCG